MNRSLIVVVLTVLIIIGAYFLLSRNSTTQPIDTPSQNEGAAAGESTETYRAPELELAFSYPAGAEGYVVKETHPSDEPSGIVRSIVLTESADAQVGMPEGGEGPATITINVFRNSQKQFPLAWAEAHPEYSGIDRMLGEREETVVGGANAIRYMADGLFPMDTVVVASGNHMYVITGMYADGEENIRNDFGPLLRTIQFIPSTQNNATSKLDINAVCAWALTYTTFTDQASADAFVAECVEGKHPEVIENYKAQLNLDGAAI